MCSQQLPVLRGMNNLLISKIYFTELLPLLIYTRFPTLSFLWEKFDPLLLVNIRKISPPLLYKIVK